MYYRVWWSRTGNGSQARTSVIKNAINQDELISLKESKKKFKKKKHLLDHIPYSIHSALGIVAVSSNLIKLVKLVYLEEEEKEKKLKVGQNSLKERYTD